MPKFKVTARDTSNKDEVEKAKMLEGVSNYIYESNKHIFDNAFCKIVRKWMQETDYDLRSEVKVEWIEEIAQEAADEIAKNDYITVPKFK